MFKRKTYSITKACRKMSSKGVKKIFEKSATWDEIEKEGFIKTILNKDYIPPFIIIESNNLEIIDGYERLLAIKEYIDGDIEIKGEGFFDLLESRQNEILNTRLDIVSYQFESNAKSLELFKTYNWNTLSVFDKYIANNSYQDIMVSKKILASSLFNNLTRYGVAKESTFVLFSMIINGILYLNNDDVSSYINSKMPISMVDKGIDIGGIVKSMKKVKILFLDDGLIKDLNIKKKEEFIAMFIYIFYENIDIDIRVVKDILHDEKELNNIENIMNVDFLDIYGKVHAISAILNIDIQMNLIS